LAGEQHVLEYGWRIALDNPTSSECWSVVQQGLRVLCRWTYEDRPHVRARPHYALDRVLKDHAALGVTDLVCLVHDQKVDVHFIGQCVCEKVESLLGEDHDQRGTTISHLQIFVG